MTEQKKAPPRVYIFHGAHHLRRREFVQRLIQRAKGKGGQEHLDLVEMDGEDASLGDVLQQALTFPFFAPRRLVILRHPLRLATREKEREAFLRMLERVPPHTALVLDIEEDLPPGHWLLTWAQKQGAQVYLRATPVPRDLGSMLRWMGEVMKDEGGQATPEALMALYSLVGDDVQRAYRELQKLALYSQALGRPVTGDDVERLALEGTPPNLFEFGHALAEGDARKAMKVLQELLQQEDPRTLWNLLVRHFRLLLLVREIQEEGDDLYAWAREERLPQFVVRRLARQARRFSLESLERLYRRLLNLEDRFRRFEITPAEALEAVVYLFARVTHS